MRGQAAPVDVLVARHLGSTILFTVVFTPHRRVGQRGGLRPFSGCPDDVMPSESSIRALDESGELGDS